MLLYSVNRCTVASLLTVGIDLLHLGPSYESSYDTQPTLPSYKWEHVPSIINAAVVEKV